MIRPVTVTAVTASPPSEPKAPPVTISIADLP